MALPLPLSKAFPGDGGGTAKASLIGTRLAGLRSGSSSASFLKMGEPGAFVGPAAPKEAGSLFGEYVPSATAWAIGTRRAGVRDPSPNLNGEKGRKGLFGR